MGLFNFYETDALTSSTTKNYVYAAPSSANGTPSFRKLTSSDIPSLKASKITSGTLSSSRLPISTTQTNSNTNIPSSSLVYSMNQKIGELDNAIASVGGTTIKYVDTETTVDISSYENILGAILLETLESSSRVGIVLLKDNVKTAFYKFISTVSDGCDVDFSARKSIRVFYF